MNCTNCGNALRPGDQFCLKCGGPAPPSNMDSSGQAAPASTSHPENDKTSQQPPESYPQQPAQAQPPQPAQAYPPQAAHAYPPHQPQPYPPSDAQSQARTLLGLAMVFSLIGGIMLMVLEFGGWHNRDDYHGIEVWGSVGPFESPLAFLAFLAVAGSLFYCSFIAYQGFSSKMGLKRGLILRGFVISIIVFVTVIIGGITLIALTWENDSQWLDAGFYGGAIGSLLTVLLFWLVLKNTPHTKVDKRAGYRGGPYPAHPQRSYTQYPQTQSHPAAGPHITQPAGPSPQTSDSQEPQVTEPEESGEPIPQEESQPAEEEEPTPQEEQEPEAKQEPQPAQTQPQQQQYPQQHQQPYYPQYQQQPQQQTYPCRTCGRPLRYVPEYRRWYCDTCRQYV